MTSTLEQKFSSAVSLTEIDTGKFDRIINGDENEVVTTDNGDVKSVANRLKVLKPAIATALTDISDLDASIATLESTTAGYLEETTALALEGGNVKTESTNLVSTGEAYVLSSASSVDASKASADAAEVNKITTDENTNQILDNVSRLESDLYVGRANPTIEGALTGTDSGDVDVGNFRFYNSYLLNIGVIPIFRSAEGNINIFGQYTTNYSDGFVKSNVYSITVTKPGLYFSALCFGGGRAIQIGITDDSGIERNGNKISITTDGYGRFEMLRFLDIGDIITFKFYYLFASSGEIEYGIIMYQL